MATHTRTITHTYKQTISLEHAYFCNLAFTVTHCRMETFLSYTHTFLCNTLLLYLSHSFLLNKHIFFSYILTHFLVFGTHPHTRSFTNTDVSLIDILSSLQYIFYFFSHAHTLFHAPTSKYARVYSHTHTYTYINVAFNSNNGYYL